MLVVLCFEMPHVYDYSLDVIHLGLLNDLINIYEKLMCIHVRIMLE